MLGNDLDYPIVLYYLGDNFYRLTPVGLVNQRYHIQNSQLNGLIFRGELADLLKN